MQEIINPRQAVLVTCREEAEVLGRTTVKDDIATLTWHTPLSSDPEMYGILLAKKRFSYELIKKSGVFAVNFMPDSFEEETLFCGSRSGEHIDKFSETGLTKEEGERIDCPTIKECAGYIECEVIEEKDIGDHVLIIGKVVNKKLKKQSKRLFHIKEKEFTTTVR